MPEVIRPWSQSGASQTDTELLAASVHIPGATCQPTFELQQLPDPRLLLSEFEAQIRGDPETCLAAADADIDMLREIATVRSRQRRGARQEQEQEGGHEPAAEQEPAAEGGGGLLLVPSMAPAGGVVRAAGVHGFQQVR